jgi:hypothetical protein
LIIIFSFHLFFWPSKLSPSFTPNVELSLFLLLLLLLFNGTANGFLPGGSGITMRHNTQKYTSHKITHHAQKKHSTQSYTNNKGHITHNDYNKKNKAVPVTGRGGL